jgi:GNAT superfamily N-acetyltransferase
MLIRPAQSQDAEALATLFMRVWSITLAPILPVGFLDQFDFEDQKAKYIERANDPNWILLVAVENGKVVGLVGARDNDVEALSYKKQIRSMYVDPDWQGKGVGSALFLQIRKELIERNAKNMMLWCITANEQARSFYEKHGGRLIEDVTLPEEFSVMPHIIYVWDAI